MDFPQPTDEFDETSFYEYTSAKSKFATNLSAVEADLEEALLALETFKEVTSGVAESERVTSFALWTYAITMYTRVFAKGNQRPWINAQLALVVAMAPKAQECHDHILGVRNKHIAHPTSDMERIRTAIELGVKPDGTFRTRATGLSVSLGGPAGPGIATDFQLLVQLLLNEVRNATQEAWDAVNKEVFETVHTPADIMKLPGVKPIPNVGPSAWRRSRRGLR